MPGEEMNQHTRGTRRSVLKGIAGSMAAGALARSTHLRAEVPAQSRGRYFDIHTHIGQVWNSGDGHSAKTLLAWMDSQEVAQAAVLPLVSPESSSYLLTTESILAATKPHRDRLIPFCCIDPRTSYSGDKRGLADMLRRYVDAGAKGFGEHKCGIPIDDPRNRRLYAVCGELKLPVLFHLDNERNMDAPGLPGLARVLADFPQTQFIGHGPGWWASISADATQADLGGYPGGTIQPGGAIDSLMEKFPNLYGDLSAGSGNGALARDMKFARDFLIRRADRLLFGSDLLSPGQEVPQFLTLRLLELPPEVEAKVYRENARRLLAI